MKDNLKINKIRKQVQDGKPLGGLDGLYYRYKDYHIIAQVISDYIIPYYLDEIYGKSIEDIYHIKDYDSLEDGSYGFHMGIPYCKFNNKIKPPISCSSYVETDSRRGSMEHARWWSLYANNREVRERYKAKLTKLEKDILESAQRKADKSRQKAEECKLKYKQASQEFYQVQREKIDKMFLLKKLYEEDESATAKYLCYLLEDSFYPFDWSCQPTIEYNSNNQVAIIEYYLPTLEECPNIKEYDPNGFDKLLSQTALKKLYEELIYRITLRTIAEIFHYDYLKRISSVCFNGRVKVRNAGTGKLEDNCILSLSVHRAEFNNVELRYVDAKVCFKHLKGVGGAKLYDYSPIVPIMQMSKDDKRFVDSHNVYTDSSTNLATMDWEEFEHLVRELFDMEFNNSGGEVKITQTSRDGGVDAIAFDPDPIRGGKIVIQAKRYTSTVGVSAVRDLYGTVINEGANKGILITTSDYGSDSYNFAKGKPITLLNGGHLLYLLEKHGKKAHIDIEQAKRLYKND